MADLDDVLQVHSTLVTGEVADALTQLNISVIDSADMRATIAQLKAAVPPSYLPLARMDGDLIAIHVMPGRAVRQSPIVYLATGSREPQFMCRDLATFPRALWIWLAGYYKKRVPLLRQPMDSLIRGIDGALPLPDRLWGILDEAPQYQPQRWNYRAQQTTVEVYEVADVGHPFLALTNLERVDPRKALDTMTAFVATHDDPASLVLSAIVETSQALDLPVAPDTALAVLRAEAWLGGEGAFSAAWSSVEPGLGEWSKALRAALAGRSLEQTPFAPLIGHPDAYSGTDPAGPAILETIADRFAENGAPAVGVGQLRNAAFVALYADGGYGGDLCAKIAGMCDRVAPQSIAATLARVAGGVRSEEA